MTRFVRSGGIWVPATRKVRVGGAWVNVDPVVDTHVRHFDGVSDTMEFSIGALGAENATGLTIMAVWKPLAVEQGGLVRVYDLATGTTAYGMNQYSDGNVYYSASGFFSQGPYTAADGWLVQGFTDPPSTGGGTANGHRYSFDSTSWTHLTGPANLGSTTIPTQIRVGQYANGEFGSILLAVIGIWMRELTVPQLETLPAGVAAFEAQNPTALLVFDQADVATSVVDRTGNGADQISRVGTTVVTSDAPSGFTF